MKSKKTKQLNSGITKRLSTWAIIVAIILMVPLLANWPWSLTDYIFGAILLFGSATAYELMIINVTKEKHRLLIGLVVATLLALAWAELAVGLFGTPFAGN